MCDKAIDFYLIKFVPDWFVTNKMLEKLENYLFFSDDIFFHYLDSNNITFLTDNMGFDTTDLNNINLDDDDDDDDDDDNFDEDDSETINHVRLMTWHKKFKQHKTCKK